MLKRNYYKDEVVDTGLLSLPGPYFRDLVLRNREPVRVHLFVVQIRKFIETGFKVYKLCICLGYLQTSAVASHSVNSEKNIELRDAKNLFPEARHRDRIIREPMYVSPIPKNEARVYRFLEQVIGIHLFTSCREEWSLLARLHNRNFMVFLGSTYRGSHAVLRALCFHISVSLPVVSSPSSCVSSYATQTNYLFPLSLPLTICTQYYIHLKAPLQMSRYNSHLILYFFVYSATKCNRNLFFFGKF